ncbi:MAG TPA: acyl-CoA thioesterase [Pyrodictium sp.]|nr:acyl-CoA thioesterase [Pyrodictium sp.]
MTGRPLFTARYRAYWSETDAAGIMHFSNFFRVLERCEEDLLASLGLVDRVIGNSIPPIAFPRVHAECSYTAPLRLADAYRVEITGIELGRTSITYRFRIVNETLGRVSAECSIVAVAYSIHEGKTIPIPEEMRKKLLEIGAVGKNREGD